MRDALDAAWGDFPTNDIGYDWLRYTGNARPSSEWVAAVDQHSRVTFIQETFSERSQQGFQAGVYDCQFAEQRARAVHPGVESIAVCVSDGNYADVWDASDYGRGWASVATLAFFPYGTPSICASFCAGAHSYLCLMGDWVPETWGGTSEPMTRLLTQVVGYSPVPNTDLNRVSAPYYPTTPEPAPPEPEEIEVAVVLHKAVEDDGTDTYYREIDDGTLVKLTKEQSATYYQGLLDGWVKVHPLGGNSMQALTYTKASADARRFVKEHM